MKMRWGVGGGCKVGREGRRIRTRKRDEEGIKLLFYVCVVIQFLVCLRYDLLDSLPRCVRDGVQEFQLMNELICSPTE